VRCSIQQLRLESTLAANACDIPKDTPISYLDIDLSSGRLCDKLRAETAYFAR